MELTQGEWRYEAVSDACRVVVGKGRQKLILARLATKQLPEAEVSANARAMAAAKDLAEALADEISPAARLAGYCQKGLMPRCRCEGCRDVRSRAALAKARGEGA